MKPPVITRMFQRAAAEPAQQGRGDRNCCLSTQVQKQPPSGKSDRIPDLTNGGHCASHSALRDVMSGQRWIRRL
jgi:hypothetical protein